MKEENKKGTKVIIEVISGCEGNCLAINNFRVAGPKPWGGGTVIQTFKAEMSDILKAIGFNHGE